MRTPTIETILIIVSSTVFAQETSLPTIISSGEASEVIMPTHVEFQFTTSFSEGSLEKSAEKSSGFRVQFENAAKTLKYNGIQLSFRTPQIHSVTDDTVEITGTIRLPIPSDADPDNQFRLYAALCESVATIGRMTQSAILQPRLFVENTEFVEQEALKRATENALYKADAIAQILNTQIYDVQQVNIEEIAWHADMKKPQIAPGIDRITCTAKVTLTYLHQP